MRPSQCTLGEMRQKGSLRRGCKAIAQAMKSRLWPKTPCLLGGAQAESFFKRLMKIAALFRSAVASNSEVGLRPLRCSPQNVGLLVACMNQKPLRGQPIKAHDAKGTTSRR